MPKTRVHQDLNWLTTKHLTLVLKGRSVGQRDELELVIVLSDAARFGAPKIRLFMQIMSGEPLSKSCVDVDERAAVADNMRSG